MRIIRWSIIARLLWLWASTVTAQTALNWTMHSPQTSPSKRTSPGMAYDSPHAQVVLYGGIDADTNALNDTWVWDGANWTQKFPQTSPPIEAARGSAIAYDAARGQVVLINGTLNADRSRFTWETWVWDGVNWIHKSPQTSLGGGGSNPVMAYDAAHGQVLLVLTEQCTGSGFFTWVWDGTNWTLKSPQTSPDPLEGYAMAFDAAHGQIVLFGGEAGDGCFNLPITSDTWLWDGSNWTRTSPVTKPSDRWLHSMIYDSAQGQVVLFGGADSNFNPFDDTWVWDGANWTETTPLTSPPARFSSGMAYDSGRSQVVMFGGNGPNSSLSDTWTLQAEAPPVVVPFIGSVVSASSYGGFAAVSPGSFVEIYGSNLAPDTRGWTKADFTGNEAPTSLDGVEVSIAGQKAFVNYIVANPGQVNVELPSNIPTGAQQITVTNKNGTSAPFNVTVNATEPGLLAPASFKIGGKQYVVAFHSDNVTYVLPEGAIAGLPSRPAKPGETIVMYGNGFGPVTPNIPAGELAEGNSQLAASMEILFGETSAKLAYYGLSPGLVGVYQFDVVVPAIPDNDLVPLTFKLAGVAGAQTLYTAVKQ
jgi:uncharacterized protein (TIGR03437 family)